MTWNPNISTERREAIGRAGRAVVRLAVDPEARESAHRQNVIVNDVRAFTDREAWDAVAARDAYTSGMPVSVFAPGSPIAADYAAALAPIIGTPEPDAQVSAEHHATA